MKYFLLPLILLLASVFTSVEAQTIPSWYYFDYTDTDGNPHNLQDYFDQEKSVFVYYFGNTPESYARYENLHLTDFYNTYGQGGNGDIVLLCVSEWGFDSVEEMSGLDYSETLGSGYENVSFTAGNPIPIIIDPNPIDTLGYEGGGGLVMFCYDDYYRSFFEGNADLYMQTLYEKCCTNLETYDPGLASSYANPMGDCEPYQIQYRLSNGSPYAFNNTDIDVHINGTFATQFTVTETVEGCSMVNLEYTNPAFNEGDQVQLAIANANMNTTNDTLQTTIANVDTVSGRIRCAFENISNEYEFVWGSLLDSESGNYAYIFGESDYLCELYLEEGCHHITASAGEGLPIGVTMLLTSIDGYGNVEDTLYMYTTDGSYNDSLMVHRLVYVEEAADPLVYGYVFENPGLNDSFLPGYNRLQGIEVTHGPWSTVTNGDGYYELPNPNPEDPISVAYDSEIWPVITSPNPREVDFFPGPYNFGLNSDDPVYGMSVDMNVIFPYICDWNIHQEFSVHNSGNQPVSGEATLTYDPLFTPISYQPEPVSTDGNSATFQVPAIGLSETFWVSVTYAEIGADYLGQSVNSQVTAAYYDNSGNLVPSDTAMSADSIFCSFDPNDIYGYPLGDGPEGLIPANTPLKYRIRFQNTGNYPAQNVVVVDTLPETLNAATFTPVSASHSVNVQFNSETRVIRWTFANIQLPDSASDPQGSIGTIWYGAEMNDLEQGEQIFNRAFIYFDSNAPVETNTSRHTIAGLTGLTALSSPGHLTVFPNPGADHLTVGFGRMVRGMLTVFDLSGRACMQREVGGTAVKVNVGKLDAGMYLLHFVDEAGGHAVGTFVKK